MLKFGQGLISFLEEITSSRSLILKLAINDFKVKYTTSYLGILWAFLQPLITIFVLWFVFSVGFKSAPVEDFPFILWLISGMLPWFFFSESLNTATTSLLEYSYLVKQVVFRVNTLPIIRILSALFVHLFFIAFLFLMFFLFGYAPSIYSLQVLYYLLATIILVIALSWITSAVVVFLRDVNQVVGVVLQLGFWVTPIFWSHKILPLKYLAIIKLNPVFYIVQGYRDAFINQVWFWDKPLLTIYFWGVTLLLLVGGIILFQRLRPHFSDVL